MFSYRSVAWYHDYFFNPSYGQAAYWIKQTDAELVLDGQVFDWAIVDTLRPNFSDRADTINDAIEAMEEDRGVDFNRFDVVVLVIGTPSSIEVNGGSAGVKSEDRGHAGILIRVGEAFDFVAHEFGHAFGMHHSYGNPSFRAVSWSQLGEYGHPYCVMSARSYGGIGSIRPRGVAEWVLGFATSAVLPLTALTMTTGSPWPRSQSAASRYSTT